MTNYKEILRLSALGISKQDIAASCQCSRNTVRNVLNAAQEQGVAWKTARGQSNEYLRKKLFPGAASKPTYRMPDYEHVHKEMQKSGVTLSLLWVEYCEECRAAGEMPYQTTQFNKYYADYVHKTKATMHLEHRPERPCRSTGQDKRQESLTLTPENSSQHIFLFLSFRIADMPMSKHFWTKSKRHESMLT